MSRLEPSAEHDEALRRAPHTWCAAELEARREQWALHIDDAECEELGLALARCLDSDRDLLAIDREAFRIPRLAPRLRALRREALTGLGIALLRGLPVARWSQRESATAFWGIGQHLGAPVSQNAQGHVLGHVTDLGLDYSDHDTRGYQTRARLPYHTDYSDLVALLCLRTARAGGLSSIASSSRIYLAMRERRPDLAAVLTRPLSRTRWGEIGRGQQPWLEVPVFNLYAGGVSTTYVRSAVDKAQMLPGAPRLSEAQLEAMDLFDTLASDPSLHLDMRFSPGDLQVVNNHCIVHSRTAYEDGPDAHDRRHLLRLWLACDDGPPFPQAMTRSFQGLTRSGRPAGIHVDDVALSAPIDVDREQRASTR